MPKVILTNDSIKETVIRPVVLDIARQVQEWTGLKETTVLFNGDAEVAAQPGSTIDDEPSFNNTASRPLWRIVARDEHITEHLLATAVHQMEHPEYFYDEALRVFLRPVYSPTLLTLEFEYRSSDITAARRWRDEVRTKISLSRNARNHTINYSYLVPEAYFSLLKHLHELRENQAGYGQSYEQWLKSSFTQSATILTTMAATHERWAVREQQCDVLGRFEFSELPDEPSKRGADSAYVQTFTYQVYFDCPIATAADYPLMVHNQLIAEPFWCLREKNYHETGAWRSPHSNTALGAFEVQRLARHPIEPGLKFPDFHEFYPNFKYRATAQIFSALVGIEPPDTAEPQANRLLMNFEEIDSDWELHPIIVDHLRWDYPYVCEYAESILNVSVYKNDILLDPSDYAVDAQLNLRLLVEPDLRSTYYVRMSLLTDPSVLSEAAKERLRQHPESFIFIGTILFPDAKNHLPKLIGDDYMPRTEAVKFLDLITRGFDGQAQSYVMSTVMHFFLQANKHLQ